MLNRLTAHLCLLTALVLHTVTPAAPIPPVAGSGTCLEFDGTDEYVYTSLYSSHNEATVECWVYSDSGGGIIDNGGAGNGLAEGQVYIVNDTLHAARWWGNGGRTSYPIPPREWHHVAAVYTNSVIRLYLDGVPVDSVTGLANPKLASDQYNWSIGGMRNGTSNWFSGRIDEVRIWDGVRTPQQILDNMYLALYGSEPGLEAYYRFDEGAGTVAYDAWGNGVDATLQNMGAENWTVASAWKTFAVPEENMLVLTAGTDGDDDSITVVVIDSPVNGSVTFDMSAAELSYVPDTDFNGADTFSYYVYDDDGAADTAVITVAVTPVNDAPVFTAGGNDTIREGDAGRIIAGWATGMDAGAPDEATQSLSFSIHTDNAGLFSVVPALDAVSGDLTYTAADRMNGEAVVYVRLYDDGGTADGGCDSSILDSFLIIVTPNRAPVTRGGNCLDFDGVDDFVQINGLTDLGGDEICIEYWFRGAFLQYGVNQFNAGIFIIAGHYNWHSFYRSQGGYVDDNSGRTSRDGNWHHVAFSWKRDTPGGFITMFDGRVISRLDSRDIGVPNVGTPLLLGSREAGANSYNTEGCLDEVRVWSTARTEDELRDYRYREVAADAPGLIAWYRFEESADTLLPDMSVNGWDGVLGNMDDTDWMPSGITDSLSLLEGDTLTIFAGYDPEGDSTFIAVKSVPANGSLAIDHLLSEITYRPDSLFEGIDSFSYYLTDIRGAVDSAHCRVEVISINAEPFFTAGGNDTVSEDSGPVTVAGWATGISAGNAYEDWQTLTFHVSAEEGMLFSVQPAVDPANGDLAYTPADNAYGESRVFVYLTDNGGTTYGGSATSPSDTFMIVVNSAGNDDPPVAEASGNVLEFDGSNDYVLTSYYDTLAAMTVECWVWPDGNGVIVDNGGYDGGAAEAYLSVSSGILYAVRGSGGGTASGALSSGEWHHVAAVFTASEIVLYINGETVDSVAGLSCPDISSVDYAWCIGALHGGTSSRFNGKIDELRVWEGIRTGTQLRNSRYQLAADDTAGLQLYYRFDHTAGTGVADASGNGWDGVLYNAAHDAWGARGGVEMFEGDTLVVSAGFNEEHDGLAITEITGPAGGTVSYDSDRTVITYIPGSEWFGVDSLEYILSDTTGLHDTTVMLIKVVPVNDAPSFITGPDDTVAEDCGTVTVAGWATGLNKGTVEESTQVLTFIITVENERLFAVLPAVSGENGDLTYTPAQYASGSSEVYLYIQDNGGTAYGGADAGMTDTFTITVTAVDDDPPVAGPYAGNALFFDGVNDYVSANPQVPAGNSAYTIEAWVNLYGGSYIVTWGGDAQNELNSLHVAPSALYNLWGWGNTLLISAGEPLLNNWHHVATTYDGFTRSLYVDGRLLGSDVPGIHNVPDSSNFYIGSYTSSSYFCRGTLDEVRIWHTARSAEELQGSMFGPLAGDEPGLAAYYRFDEWTGSLLQDYGPDGSDGTLINMTGTEWGRSGAWGTPAAFEDIPLTFVAGYDPDGDSIAAHELSAPVHGSLDFDTTAGTVIYLPGTDFSGVDSFRYAVTAPDGLADTVSLAITVTAVNDPPVFIAGNDDTVNAGAVQCTVSGWATGIHAGAPDESTQVLAFITSCDHPGLFITLPGVDAVTGDLTYTPAGYVAGTATVYIQLQDNGGDVYGGSTVSAVDSFTIVVQSDYNSAPVAGAGLALEFNGSDEYVLTALYDTLREATVECWVYTDSGGGIIDNGGAGSGSAEMQIYISNDTLHADRWWGNGGSTAVPVTPGQWHHAAAVFTTSEIRLYLNGEQVNSVTGLSNPDLASDDYTWCIGGLRGGTNSLFSGRIDEVRIWSTVRTAEDIRMNAYTPLTGSEPGLLAYFRCDAAAAGYLVDATGNSSPAQFINMDSTNRVLSDAWATIPMDEDETLSVTCGYDADGDSLAAGILSMPAGGSLTQDAAGVLLTYIPAADWWGSDTFSYYVADTQYADTHMVAVVVEAVADPVTITSAAADTSEEVVPYAYAVTLNDIDGDAVISMPIAPGWVSLAGDTARGTAPYGARGDTVMTFIAANGTYADTLTVALAIKDSNGIVPVELSSFTAVLQGGVVVLDWTTETETGNLGFNVLHGAAPAGPFSQVNAAMIPGAGTTAVPQAYRFTDADNGAGTGFYRLEQVDIDGIIAYSDAVSITIVSEVTTHSSERSHAFTPGGLYRLDGRGVRAGSDREPGIYLYRMGDVLVKDVVAPE